MIKVVGIAGIEEIIKQIKKVEADDISFLSHGISYRATWRKHYLHISEIIGWLVRTERDKLNFIEYNKVEYKIAGDQLLLTYSDNFIDSKDIEVWISKLERGPRGFYTFIAFGDELTLYKGNYSEEEAQIVMEDIILEQFLPSKLFEMGFEIYGE